MRFCSFIPAVLSGLLLSPAGAVVLPRAASLSWNQGKQLFTFDYSTSAPSSDNWIGIFPSSGGGPIAGQRIDESPSWNWARDGSGSLTLATDKLIPGYHYKAYFLGGSSQYEQQAEPVEIFLPGPGGNVNFFLDSTALRNGRVGDDYEAKVGGLLSNLPSRDYKFAKTNSNNGDWVKIDNTGKITGRPTKSGLVTVTIEASNGAGSRDSMTVQIKVVDAGAQLVENIEVVSFNLWHGGNNVDNYHEKQARYLSGVSADIVGFQESHENLVATSLGQAFGWYSLQYGDTAMVSKYPIAWVGKGSSRALQARVALDGDAQQVMLWDIHTAAYPYGPYAPCFDGKGVDAIAAIEGDGDNQSHRGSQVREMMQNMADDIRNADNIPVLLTGDFNAPSHLDWIPSTKDQHCGVSSFGWPTSKLPIQGGLIDSYREQHPDPVTSPGYTWSPIYLTNGDYGNRPEPLDRIDFVYYRGRKLTSTRSDAMMVGNPKPEDPNPHRDNEWPTDHKAVRTSFKVTR